jgi:aldehyde dehydrogenase (NAD+)
MEANNTNSAMAGQVCTSTSRIYVQESVYEKFLEEFKKYTQENTTIGSQFDSNVTHGPQISKSQQEKIMSYVDSAKSEGARLILGGEVSKNEKGFFVDPTIFADVSNDMKASREEVFGPFVVVSSFKDEDEVVEKANDTEYGLGAAVFTKDIVRGHRVAGEIQAGMVWVCLVLGSSLTSRANADADQQLARQPLWHSVRRLQAEWYWQGAWVVCARRLHSSEGCSR